MDKVITVASLLYGLGIIAGPLIIITGLLVVFASGMAPSPDAEDARDSWLGCGGAILGAVLLVISVKGCVGG